MEIDSGNNIRKALRIPLPTGRNGCIDSLAPVFSNQTRCLKGPGIGACLYSRFLPALAWIVSISPRLPSQMSRLT